MNTPKKILLLSTSTVHGSSYLEYCEEVVKNHFENAKRILFVPFAQPSGISYDEYTAKASSVFKAWGFEMVGAHSIKANQEELHSFDGIFIGGGNTFLLLKQLYETGWYRLIKDAVEAGVPYMGTSAGSNIGGLTIGTTNDMPIVYPPSFDAFAFINVNLNPHYLDPDPTSKHMGETRETRIAEFHKQNFQPVVGLREGSWLRFEGGKLYTEGALASRVFRKDMAAIEVESGSDISWLCV